jgi:peroxiredoxin Q/BCP
MPTIGETAPDFEMLNHEGKPVKLSDFRGKKVILYFYPEDFTSGCEFQACRFRDRHDEIAAKNAVVLGVSHNDADSHQRFREAHKLPFTLLVDEGWQQAQAWGAWGLRPWDNRVDILRSQFVIDENGTLIDAVIPVKYQESVDLAMKHLE